MSIFWKKPLRIVDLHEAKVIYLKRLDNVSETVHLIEVDGRVMAIYDDGVLPGENCPWIENIPEDQWKIVATSKKTYSSKEEVEKDLSTMLFRNNWDIECVKK